MLMFAVIVLKYFVLIPFAVAVVLGIIGSILYAVGEYDHYFRFYSWMKVALNVSTISLSVVAVTVLLACFF